ncbi:hypothetical protein VNO77_33471 [Canavalia gladiata]|uniref:Uncharacterized protein n=1 Tax=Canavalia gladiata TaxID=3824 RepID=A0AAN9KDD7_CANGL
MASSFLSLCGLQQPQTLIAIFAFFFFTMPCHKRSVKFCVLRQMSEFLFHFLLLDTFVLDCFTHQTLVVDPNDKNLKGPTTSKGGHEFGDGRRIWNLDSIVFAVPYACAFAYPLSFLQFNI